ncbi:hypothetical protein AB6A40_004220 [Gnathostoma spinigerum]|uniref:Uncharacterized protein n=1 Tax=Gnathostoma spinigerum TaxID=75299 RepID=A0ABD6ECW9_9BILA
MGHVMIESLGNKLFKSVTETADEISVRFESLFANFSGSIADDADALVVEVVSLSKLLKVVLCVLVVLLIMIIIKYAFLGFRYSRLRYRQKHPAVDNSSRFLIVAIPMSTSNSRRRDSNSISDESREMAVRFQTAKNDDILLGELQHFFSSYFRGKPVNNKALPVYVQRPRSRTVPSYSTCL